MCERPAETGADAAFQARLADGRLWLQTCETCNAVVFGPRMLCPSCGRQTLDWRPASGRGTVHTRAVLLRRPKEGATAPQKHCIVLIDLEEGPRMMSHLPNVAADDITIGMPVNARIIEQDGTRIVVFDPSEVAS